MSTKFFTISTQSTNPKSLFPFSQTRLIILIGLLAAMVLSACVAVAQPTGSSLSEESTTSNGSTVPVVDPALDGRLIKERLERPGYYDIYTVEETQSETAAVEAFQYLDGREIKERLERPGYYDIYSTEAAQAETTVPAALQYLDGREYKEWLEQHPH